MRGERSKDIASSQAPALADLRYLLSPLSAAKLSFFPPILLPHLHHCLISFFPSSPICLPLRCPTASHPTITSLPVPYCHILLVPLSHLSLSHCHNIPPCHTVASLPVPLSHPSLSHCLTSLHPFIDLHLPQYDTHTTLQPHDLV
jgi:hypothetical protein